MTRKATTVIMLLLAGSFVLLMSQSARAQQLLPYTSLDPEALQVATRTLADSAGTEAMMLGGVNSGGISFDDGTASIWQYTFTDSIRRSRSVVVIKLTSGMQAFMGPEYLLPDDAPVPYALDTTGAFSRSEQIIDPLRADNDLADYLARFPDTGLESIALSTYLRPAIAVPESFPAGAPFWQLTTSRRGDSVMACLVSSVTGETRCALYFDTTADFEMKESETGNVQFVATNYGVFGNNPATGEGTLVVPRGSGNSYLFGSGLWFAARVRVAPGSDSLEERSFITYDPNSGTGWAVPGDGYDRPAFSSHPDLYHSVDYDLETGANIGGASDLNWPLWMPALAEESTMLEPGRYVPFNRQRTIELTGQIRPAFVPAAMEQFTSRYNDSRTSDFTQQAPIGLRVEENIFVPNEGLADNAVIVQYRVMNVSGDTLRDCAVATVMDFDLGNAPNDRAAFYDASPELRSAYALPGSEPSPMGTLVMTMIEAPRPGEDGFVDNSARRQFNETGTVSTFQSWTLGEDSTVLESRLGFMTAGTIDPDLGPGDRRAMLVGESFSMLPGDTANYANGYTVLPSVTPIGGASPELESRVDALLRVYYNLPTGLSVPARPAFSEGSLKLAIAPNPARQSARLAIMIPSRSDVRVSIVNMLGREVMTVEKGTIGSGLLDMPLDLTSLDEGLYLVTVSAGNLRRTIPLTVTR